jgi:hypothetical protein
MSVGERKKCLLSHVLSSSLLTPITEITFEEEGKKEEEEEEEEEEKGGLKCLKVPAKHGVNVTLSMKRFKNTEHVDFYW